MRYKPPLEWTGTDEALVTISDQGNTGEGGELIATVVVSIEVLPLSRPPILHIPETFLQLDEDTTSVFAVSVSLLFGSDQTEPLLTRITSKTGIITILAACFGCNIFIDAKHQ